MQAMRAAAEALQRARPSAVVYDRRRKVEWALRLQQRWLRWGVHQPSRNTAASGSRAGHSGASCRRRCTCFDEHSK